ncbi:MAG: tRNA pseudouridine(55) synthase TruB [Myxococcales bacterium]|nr:tRNA pseudouridine(55) synthase TruB [Myxococcales bacterium]
MQRVDGVLVLDKPYGMTSADAVAIVKRRFAASRVGHTGTLDPLATGVLPICLGEATKIAGYMLADDKVYEAGLTLGQATATYDCESPVTMRNEARAQALTAGGIAAVLTQFVGELAQVPPQHSAIKVAGKPLFESARAGKLVEVAPRKIFIKRLELKSYDYPRLELEVACSKGTYIRSLAHDIGLALGCYAHLYSLRRTQSGAVRIDDAIGIAALDRKSAELPPLARIDDVLSWPIAEVPASWIAPIRVGRPMPVGEATWRRGSAPAPRDPQQPPPANPSPEGMCLLAGGGELLSMARIESGSFVLERGFVEGLTVGPNSFMVRP